MLLSALSFLVVAQSSSEVPEGLMNNPVLFCEKTTLEVIHIKEKVIIPIAFSKALE